MPQAPLPAHQRLIVALDVPSEEEAVGLVERLPNVAFFKLGLEALLSGGMTAICERLAARGGGIFADLKLGGDIETTIVRMVRVCLQRNIRFLTLVKSSPPAITERTLAAGVAARGESAFPRFLMVPLLSSMDEADLPELAAGESVADFIIQKGETLRKQGCDGLIVSGDAIRACRRHFPPDFDLVSPGIRPQGAAADDHKRATTPSQAIAMGADYLVVGRPITQAANPQAAAQEMIEEIDRALAQR